MLRDINSKKVTPVGKRKAVVHLMEVHQVSQRRACDVLQIDRSTVRYQSRCVDDTEQRDGVKRVSRERRRFGCRRVHVMIARDGFEVAGNALWAQGSQWFLPDGPNQRWSLISCLMR